MKSYNLLFLIVVVMFASCKKEYLDRPDQNAPSLETYYTTAEQVNGATGLLYGSAWGPYMDRAFLSVGDIMGGTGVNLGTGDYAPYMNFTVSQTDPQVLKAWQAFYKAAGVSTILIRTFETKKASVSDPAYLNKGIAEAKFMRAVAYFYLTRLFKDVPIVTDPVALASSSDFNVPRYNQSDVLKFIIKDLQDAEAALPGTAAESGRVTSYSATGMLAKVYLYMKDYENAKVKALEVINSGKFNLYPDYYKMFSTATANGNIESLFEFRWVENGDFASGNHLQTNIGPGAILNPVGAGGYSSVVPSITLLTSFEPGDQRRKSIMEHGFFRADWTNPNFPNGFRYDTLSTTATVLRSFTPTRSNSAKYVIGPGSNGEKINGQSNNMSTYILRYADILLIYAEAALGSSASTSDAQALQYFNKVRHRAGFPVSQDKTSLNLDLILHERMIEFNFEGDYWFDVSRQGFEKAREILGNQERGQYSTNNGIRTIQHADVKAQFVSPNQLYLPVPAAEISVNPLLAQPAVSYY
ncbi:RagB/SusD family nutrient uptake outer membrane protein [Arcticibacter eurypsychrophilus]|uniref:RagB/SusD family nutrient uptake outer membrane protein n=1 Tax=Arcticibacter eurypsychrophilus TaxID=1434752 RepID=UPI00084DD691|nr:RagB/SusD family nutrient uptake outer membrane protein [Arcticibacter eurypsychrophilus]